MTRKIRLRRGMERDLPLLDGGELAVTIDTRKVFFGTGARNIRVATYSEIETLLGISEGDLDGLTGLKEVQETLESIQVFANEVEFSAHGGQVEFELPTGANPSSGWIEVFINGLRIPKQSFVMKDRYVLKLTIDSSLITSGTQVIVKWPEETVPASSGHEASHRAGGADAIRIDSLEGYSDHIEVPFEMLTSMLGDGYKGNVIYVGELPEYEPPGTIRGVVDESRFYIKGAENWTPYQTISKGEFDAFKLDVEERLGYLE